MDAEVRLARILNGLFFQQMMEGHEQNENQAIRAQFGRRVQLPWLRGWTPERAEGGPPGKWDGVWKKYV